MESNKVRVGDTTLREGDQSGLVTMTVNDMLSIVKRLDEFGVPDIEAPWPVPVDELIDAEGKQAGEKVSEFYRMVQALSVMKKIFVFGSTREKGVRPSDSKRLKALIDTDLINFTIFGKSWKRHVFEVLKTTLIENLGMIETSVRYLKRRGGKVYYDAEHFFDGYLEDPKYALETLNVAIKGGADAVILCDTNGGMLPSQASSIIRATLSTIGDVAWGVHMHDDGGLALANTLCAVDFGATHVQCTVNGDSERVGMPSMTSLLPNLIIKKGVFCEGITDLSRLKDFSEFVAAKTNNPLSAKTPFVGSTAFLHLAASHLKVVKSEPSLQEHIRPDLVGATRQMPISGVAGRNAIVEAATKLGFTLEVDGPIVAKILRKVKQLDSQGLHLEAAQGSFEVWVFRYLDNYLPPFQVTKIKPSSDLFREKGQWKWGHSSKAMIEVWVPQIKEPLRVWNEGRDGPVDATNNSLKKALAVYYPVLADVRLVDYKVHILSTNGEGTAAKVRVTVTAITPFGQISTVAISENILLASANALMDLFELVVHMEMRNQ